MTSSVKDFFSLSDQQEIRQAIEAAEMNTSGEIRIHLENNCKADVLDRAAYVFKQLHMERTELRNGILIYLAIKDRKFAIIGDSGINAVVPEGFWDKVKEQMADSFRKGEFKEGLCAAVTAVGDHLKKFFPYQKEDTNELSDDISFGNK